MIIAYIDGANLHKGVKGLGWDLDYARFYVYLKEKYKVDRVYLFLGMIPKYKNLYTKLQEFGYTLVFKETTYDGNGKVKGNCDAILVHKITCDFYEKQITKCIIVSSDGDYAELVSFLKEKEVFKLLISPSNKCSFLLRKQNIPILYLDTQKDKLAVKEKAPGEDKTSQGSFS